MRENKLGNEVSLLFISLRHSLKLLGKNDPMRMAGATAFFTTFALPPIVFILSQLFGFFLGRSNMGRELIEKISNTLGKDGAEQVRQVVRSIHGFSNSWYVLVFGFIFLVFVAKTSCTASFETHKCLILHDFSNFFKFFDLLSLWARCQSGHRQH